MGMPEKYLPGYVTEEELVQRELDDRAEEQQSMLLQQDQATGPHSYRGMPSQVPFTRYEDDEAAYKQRQGQRAQEVEDDTPPPGGGMLLPGAPTPSQGGSAAPAGGSRERPSAFAKGGPLHAFSPSDPTGQYSGFMGFLASPLMRTIGEGASVGLAGLRNNRDNGAFQNAMIQRVMANRDDRSKQAAQAETMKLTAGVNQLIAAGKYGEALTMIQDGIEKVRKGEIPTSGEMLNYLTRMEASLAQAAAKKGEKQRGAKAAMDFATALAPEATKGLDKIDVSDMDADDVYKAVGLAIQARSRMQHVSHEGELYAFDQITGKFTPANVGATGMLTMSQLKGMGTEIFGRIQQYAIKEGTPLGTVVGRAQKGDVQALNTIAAWTETARKDVEGQKGRKPLDLDDVAALQAVRPDLVGKIRFLDELPVGVAGDMAVQQDNRKAARAGLQGVIEGRTIAFDRASGSPVAAPTPNDILRGTYSIVNADKYREAAKDVTTIRQSLDAMLNSASKVLAKERGKNFLAGLKTYASQTFDRDSRIFESMQGSMALSMAKLAQGARASDIDLAAASKIVPTRWDTAEVAADKMRFILEMVETLDRGNKGLDIPRTTVENYLKRIDELGKRSGQSTKPGLDDAARKLLGG